MATSLSRLPPPAGAPAISVAVQTFRTTCSVRREKPSGAGRRSSRRRPTCGRVWLSACHVRPQLPRLKARALRSGWSAQVGRARFCCTSATSATSNSFQPRQRCARAVSSPTDRFLKTWQITCAPCGGGHGNRGGGRPCAERSGCRGRVRNIGSRISEGYSKGCVTDPNSSFFRVFMHRYAGNQLVHVLVTATPTPSGRSNPLNLTISAAGNISSLHIANFSSKAEHRS